MEKINFGFDELNILYNNLEDDVSKLIFTTKIIENITQPKDTDLVKYINPNLRENHKNWTVELQKISDGETVIIYGASSSGDMVRKEVRSTINILFCDRNYKEIKTFNNHFVISPEELISKYKDCKIFLCTSSSNQVIEDFLVKSGVQKRNIIEAMYYDYKKQYFDDFITYGTNEVFLDIGGYNGSTSVEFVKNVNQKYKKIYIFEPDQLHQEKINNNSQLNELENIELIKIGAWDKKETLKFNSLSTGDSSISDNGEIIINCDAIDNIISDEVTFIKMDIEGAELNALIGAKNIIQKYKPKLAISVYHKPGDIITIQSFIQSIVSDYKFYLRHYSIDRAETVLYAI